MRISQLDGLRVALWGWGREGRAAYRALRTRDPGSASGGTGGAQQPLTLFCSIDEAGDATALNDPALTIQTSVDADALSAFDVVIKSPGISPYGESARAAAARGTRFIGGTALWFAQQAAAGEVARNTICVTGTKGKSTTTALLAHLLRAAGHRTALAGNIGLPLLELPRDDAPAFHAIELSSYQTGAVADSGVRPDVAIAVNIFPEHLDWHGTHARYVADKLRLLADAKPRIAVLNANDPILSALDLPDSHVHLFGHDAGWHLRGTRLHMGAREVMDTASLPLPGHHNRSNLCAVLTALDALGLDGATLAAHASTFQPLPHRLQLIGSRAGVDYVNDSISTTPHASLAALDVFRDRPVAILLGGHDRGLEWHAFLDAIRRDPPHAVVTMGQTGPRIFEQVAPIAAQTRITLHAAADMSQAVAFARDALPDTGGVVLLSPGAPSFGVYKDYVARGRDFARVAGFDPDAISAIAGLGVS